MSSPSWFVLRGRFVNIALTLACCTISILMTAAPAQAAGPFFDPVFGVLVEPGKASYAPLPADVARRCPGLPDGSYLLFARVRDPAGEAYLIQTAPSNGDGTLSGFAIRLAPSGCTIEPSLWALSGRPLEGAGAAGAAVPALPGDKAPKICPNGEAGVCHYVLRSAGEARLLRALIDDAFLRAQQAFGGPAKFKAAACRRAVMENSEDYPAVHEKLTGLCGMW